MLCEAIEATDANGERAETSVEGYEPSLKSETNILEEWSPIDEGLSSWGKGSGTSERPVRRGFD